MKNILLILSILSIYGATFAQTSEPEHWRKLNGAHYAFAQSPIDSDIILIATEDGIIKKTTDGGVTWDEKSTGVSNVLIDLKPFSGDDFIGLTTMSELVVSHDAGETWSSSTLKDSLGNKIQTLTEIVILSETEAIVKQVTANPVAVITDDAGITWDFMETRQPKSLFNVNDTLIGIDHIAQGFITVFGLLRSIDQGQTYDTIAVGPSGLFGNGFHNQFKKGYENISFVNTQIFFINVNGRSFFKTVNGGESFVEIDYPGSNFVYDMFFLSSNTGFVSVSGNSVQYTNDGGATWTWLQNEGVFGGPIVIKYLGMTQSSLFMSDNYNTYVVDTSDVEVSAQNVIPQNLGKATIVNDSILLVPFENYFFKSINGGLTWNKTPEIRSQFNDKINFGSYATVGSDSIFIVDNTRIHLSTDGGETFAQVFNNTTFNPQYNYFKNLGGGRLIMVGNGAILYTIDGGVNWVAPQGVGFSSPNAIEAVSLDAIYVLDFNRNVLFSSDTGQTFVNVNGDLPTRDNATKFMFLNKTTGFLYGNSGYIYKTENGGENWTNLKDSIPTDRNQHWDRMAAKSENEIYIMDGDGTGGTSKIFYSLDGGDTWNKSTNNLHLDDPQFMMFKPGAQGLSTGTLSVHRSGFPLADVSEIEVGESVTAMFGHAIEHNDISIYPNPCDTELHVVSENGIIKSELYNSRGERLKTVNSEHISLVEMNPGVYHVRVYTSTDAYNFKVLKK